MEFRKLLAAVLVTVSASALAAQSFSSSREFTDTSTGGGSAGASSIAPAPAGISPAARPFSKVAFGTGISPLGVQLSMTTFLSPHFNLRTSGNLFNYANTFTASVIGARATLNMKSAGTALDIYPFHKGFRISPGLLFYNGNQVTADASVAAGENFTLNDQTYYSSRTHPVTGNALLNLHTTHPAFTVTTGWGNTIPRKGHWSFPFELGVALTGAPSLKVNLGGWACYDPAQTLCTDIASKTDPIALQIQDNLAVQVDKWTRDVEPLKTYPIASFGVAYSFGLRNE